MQPRLSSQRETAMTLFEVGVVIAIVVILAAVFLPMLGRTDGRTHKIVCVNNLKQINLAYKIWEGDNGDIFPMGISITNGGSMEMVQTGNVVQTFLAMSNELSTPIILFCPEDTGKFRTKSFTGLSNSNISYFVGVDVTNDMNPQAIIIGDCNFELRGVPVKSGLYSFWTNDPVAWQATRHINSGNLGLADGSVQSATSSGLQTYLQQTGFATNRFAIP
jgi:competence protein ComGC